MALNDEFFGGVAFAISFVEGMGREIRKEKPPGAEFGTATCDAIAEALTEWLVGKRGKSDE